MAKILQTKNAIIEGSTWPDLSKKAFLNGHCKHGMMYVERMERVDLSTLTEEHRQSVQYFFGQEGVYLEVRSLEEWGAYVSRQKPPKDINSDYYNAISKLKVESKSYLWALEKVCDCDEDAETEAKEILKNQFLAFDSLEELKIHVSDLVLNGHYEEASAVLKMLIDIKG